MIGNDLAALLVWQSNYMTPYEAFAFGLLMVYAAKTIFMSCRCGVHACFGSCSLTAFFFLGAGELFISHTCNVRNHKRQMEGHSQPKLQVTVATWKEHRISGLKTHETYHASVECI